MKVIEPTPHDSLCPTADWTPFQHYSEAEPCMNCELIAKVRADERMSFDRSKEYLAYEVAVDDAIAAVEAAQDNILGETRNEVVIAALRALLPEGSES